VSDLEFWEYFFIIGSILTYICWGFVFAIEALLLMHGRPEAVEWVKSRYSFKTFRIESLIFMPMIYLFYILLEIIPGLIGLESAVLRFSPKELIERAKEVLE